MTLCYLIVSLNDTVDDIGITTLTYQTKKLEIKIEIIFSY